MCEGHNGFLQFTFWLLVKTKQLKVRLERNHSSGGKHKEVFFVGEVEVLKLRITKFQNLSYIE